ASFGAAMADIAMLLLIFFMSTTTAEPPKSTGIDLPEAVTESADRDVVYITINKKKKIFFDGDPVTLENLRFKLMSRTGDINKLIAVTADRNLEYIDVLKVLEILQKNDFLNVIFMSQPKEDFKN
ncbi:ExbD/TolR family protein, partial [Spirochaetota bacterium]